MPTGIELSAGIVVGAAKPIDAKFGPYSSTSAALADIGPAIRYKGLTIGIQIGSVLVEYWFRDGTTDVDFVEKNTTSLSPTPPASAPDGAQWVDPASLRAFIRYGGVWAEIQPAT
jgi:hypothetical protein